MPAPIRFAYMTNYLPNLQAARNLAALDGYAVDMLPPDAPVPEPGTYDGIMVDFGQGARHALERKTFLDKLVQMAKVFPIVVYDTSANYKETAIMRAAGINWFPVLKSRAFAAMLAHPLAKKVAATSAEEPKPDQPKDEAASEVTSAS
jgi:hypothetical protein